MTPQTIPQTVLFPDLFDKPLVATFDRQHASSDGGAVLLKAAERVYGLLAGFARCLVDRRELGKIRHTLTEARPADLRHCLRSSRWQRRRPPRRRPDPQAAARAGPGSGRGVGLAADDLRFENGVGRSALCWDASWRFIERHQQRLAGQARRSTIDLDPTDDATHGAQQLTFFNGHYDSWCYLPLLAFLTFEGTRTVSVRGGAAARQCAGHPRDRGRVVSAAAHAAAGLSPAAVSRAARRGLCDAGGLRLPGCRAAARLRGGMAKNAVLQRHAEPALLVAQAQSAASGQTAHVYADTRYRARTWDRDRRVVIKAEVVRLGDREPRDNQRFVVPTCARRRVSSMNGSTAPAATSRTGSRSCSMACRSTARAAVALGQSTARAPHRRRTY